MDYPWAVPGQRVMCIKTPQRNRAYPGGPPPSMTLPSEGVTYTIRDVAIRPNTRGLYLRLEEIINPPMPGCALESGFLIRCFRPVKQTDISVFKKIAKRIGGKVEA